MVILPSVQSVKATALIFGRTPASATSTSTSTTESSASDDKGEVKPNWIYTIDTFNKFIKFDQVRSSDKLDEEEVTKPPLTGIPQIDYIWDPNLPRELNGYE